MRSFISFTKKEWLFHMRSGKITVILLIFLLLGIMNPAIAKLTPWMLEAMSESLSEAGMTVSEVTVDAMTSWVQFFKNAPMGLIVFVLIEASIFTDEYRMGTMVMILTKGIKRYKVILAKASVMTVLWSGAYWLSFAVTYGYNSYFWDNSVAQSLIPSVVYWWLFGMLCTVLILFFSAIMKGTTSVLLGVGASVLFFYILTLFAKVKKFSPALLMDGNSLIYGAEDAEAYVPAVMVTSVLVLALTAASIPLFNKRQV
ncbi:MAG: ABC transporter permease subunit [Clostridia bacterium]|nr:ABC transporter permease subunit [Clostridia bacterium]